MLKIKAGRLIVTGCILCMVVLLSLTHRTSISNTALLNHSRGCDCSEEKEEMNLLHTIPLLLLPALETADSD